MNGNDKKFFETLMDKQTEVLNGKLDLVHERLNNTEDKLTGRHAALIDIVTENTKCIKVVKKETSPFRWVYRNPFKFIISLAVFVIIVTSMFNMNDVINFIYKLVGK